MTNSEAAKIHLTDCRTVLTSTECVGHVQALGYTHNLRLQFSTTRKRLEVMELIIWEKVKSFSVEEKIRKDLLIPICLSSMTPDDGDTCYKKPRSVQFISFVSDTGLHRKTNGNNAHYSIYAASGSSNADYFFHERPKLKSRAEAVKKFQNGQ